MEIIKSIKVTKDEVVGYKCDHCSLEFPDNCARLIYNPGYGSQFDGDYWELHLCEICWLKIFEIITKKTPRVDDDSPYLRWRVDRYDV